MKAQDIIDSALRLINVLASGESPSTDESNDALDTLNDLLDSWNAQRLAIFTVARQVFNLTSGQQSYTFGTGGNFNASRPARIERVSIITQVNPPQPLEMPIRYLTTGEWQQVPVKNIESTFPIQVYDDGGFPLRTLNFWPIPNIAGIQTVIYGWQALSQFADLDTTDYEFPPGYAKALRYNLAVDLAPEYGVIQMNPLVVAQAQTSLGVVKALNEDSATEPLYCDAALSNTRGQMFDWRTGGPVGGGIR